MARPERGFKRRLAHSLPARVRVPCGLSFAGRSSPVTRSRIFSIRLAITLAVLGLLVALLRFVWYPDAHFSLAGTARFVWILAAVACIVGPCLTAMVYRAGKRGLGFDIAILAVVEAVAVVWAAVVLYERRPYYAVFAVDRFEVVALGELESTVPVPDGLRMRPGHEPRLVYAALPDDVERRNALIDDVIFGGGPDIDRRPEFWHPYAAGAAAARARARPLTDLSSGGDKRARILTAWLASQPGRPGEYAYLPIRGRAADALLILHAKIGYPVDILVVDPW